jgi:hypothetical protein
MPTEKIFVTKEWIGNGTPDTCTDEEYENEANWKDLFLPAKYEVCPTCQGKGTTSNHLGAFTSDQMDEMDDDWKDDYIAGTFDRNCEECKGQRVILVPDKALADPMLLERYQQEEEDKAYCDSIQRQEQAFEMGSYYGIEEGWYD